MKVQTKPISDPIIPCNNEDISTQLIRVKNNAFGEVGNEKNESSIEGHSAQAAYYLRYEWWNDY